jgi:hypothetical protein
MGFRSSAGRRRSGESWLGWFGVVVVLGRISFLFLAIRKMLDMTLIMLMMRRILR